MYKGNSQLFNIILFSFQLTKMIIMNSSKTTSDLVCVKKLQRKSFDHVLQKKLSNLMV